MVSIAQKTSIIQRRGGCRVPISLLRAAASVMICLLASPAAAGVEEEELVSRDIQFSVPQAVTDYKRDRAERSGLSLLTATNAFWGTDTNIHRSPVDLEQSGGYWGDWLYLRADTRFGGRDRLLATLNWKQIHSPSQSMANFRRIHLSTWYAHRVSERLGVELDIDISSENDHATTIIGKEYTRDYSYGRYALEALVAWNIAAGHRVKFGGERVVKDYGEKQDLNSLDWGTWTFKVRYRLRFGAYHYLRVWYSLGDRKYDEEPAGSRNGVELPENPLEEHRYQEVLVWYSLPIAGVLSFDARYAYNSKDDLFEQYESWRSHTFEAWAGANVRDRLEAGVQAGRHFRKYDHIIGDDVAQLEYTRWNLAFGLRFRVWRPLWLFGDVSHYWRDTNRSDGIYFRDYSGFTCSAGVSFFL